MKSVEGTYALVSNPNFGDQPSGLMILTANGYYSNSASRTTRPKIAAADRRKGTPEENKAIFDGSISHYGRYSIDDGKTITLNIQWSSYPNWNGITQKRALKVSGEQLSYTVPSPSSAVSTGPTEVVWKRIKQSLYLSGGAAIAASPGILERSVPADSGWISANVWLRPTAD
ncbi:MAG: lipocalin-like domain-containing protein [Rhodoferax sp.]|nr:lipocalin-like domain-containing protein [Rhodoferax sp.]